MAIYATQATRVTDQMFIEAAHGVADQVTQEQLQQGLVYPLQSNILEVEIKTAAQVAKLVFDGNLARPGAPATGLRGLHQKSRVSAGLPASCLAPGGGHHDGFPH